MPEPDFSFVDKNLLIKSLKEIQELLGIEYDPAINDYSIVTILQLQSQLESQLESFLELKN